MIPANRHPFAKVETDYFPCMGGLDLVTPPLVLKPGFCREALNWECHTQVGYSTSEGYEKFDGRPSPSDATYTILLATITGAWAVGNTVTGNTSAATGQIIAADATGNSYFAFTKVAGTFVSGEALKIGGVTIATSTAAPTTYGASTSELDAQYRNLAADVYRADILAVPGSGDVLGVKSMAGVTYAFRANAGNTAVDLYKSTTAGWVQVTFDKEISFTAGGGDIDEADTMTQGGVTATIKRVVIQSGTLAGGTAAGRLIIGTPSGGNFIAGAATTTGAGALTLSGAQTNITMAVGGRFEFVVTNFAGAVPSKRMYGCDGKNRGFEFDGTVFVPIATGMTTDKPNYVAYFANSLIFGFGPSVQISSITKPYQWTPITGAGEFNAGDNITGFAVLPGGQGAKALLVATRNRLNVLYGTSTADFQLVGYQDDAGAYAYSLQLIGNAVMLDDRGFTTLTTSQAFGNFASASISNIIKTFVNEHKGLAQASCIARDKNQYRVFFSNKYALYITFDGNKIIGMMPQLLVDEVTCITSDEFSDGAEKVLFGSSDGFVYQMDKGTSFDGDRMESYINLAFNHTKSPRTIKHYRKAVMEISGSGYSKYSFSHELGYGSPDVDQPGSQTISSLLSGFMWDGVVPWDSGFWDSQSLAPSEIDIDGDGENISIRLYRSSDYYDQITINGVMVHFSYRRQKR
ncbi:hypothetical protein UFOVP891_49 [uncultured Caudovirales phage]|uniref:Uncharacterized protein n=1 Tax=uncultured Caudovirales phage TaxID=2100421 RepID=A0A6J5RGE6_9CAUD|nr:hypothetical protein UFOVP472_18 [uncultured Caudovirales phage]CAB4169194.1 hypothetical protein UFOVP891_49 [uncultured Caudovirales phage]CAB4180758.1 hypothetical protein UFOVP1053_18 [uncultured Caudovirales phage]CAB4196079.1 hypothetical protein UFOVP1297_55 [uncultured Caudovirales phage]CAB4221897.1 hypothetical protein UFOVP1647_33 [uncultured Caudovirales phage]